MLAQNCERKVFHYFLCALLFIFRERLLHSSAYIFLTIWLKTRGQIEYDQVMIPLKFQESI